MQIRRLRSHSRNNPNLPDLPDLWNLDHNSEQEVMADTGSQTNNANNVATTQAEEWKTNPDQGNRFNPGSAQGRKIFQNKTQGLPEDQRLDLTKDNSFQFKQAFNSRKEHLGPIVTKVPIEFNADGSVKKTASLLTQIHQIKLEDVQRAAHNRYSNNLAPTDRIPESPFILREIDPANNTNDRETFYDRVGSNIVAQTLKNILTPSGWEEL